MKNKEQQEHFQKTGHLINKKIQCNKCETEITMFGSNLENRINKFGTLWSLLDEFKCRSCVSAAKPKKEKKVSVRFIKRKEKEAKKELPIPQVKQFVPRNILLKDAPDLQDSISASGACLRPDIFLNSGRKCDDCPYVQNCNATCKTTKYVTA
jgi:hypothetical protein